MVIGLLQIIIAMDHIISLSNQVCKNFLEAGNMRSFDFILALNIQKVLSFTQIAVAFFHIWLYITRFPGSETSSKSHLTVVV